MKKFELILLVIVFLASVFLFAKEQRLQRQIEALSAANQQLREESAGRAAVDPDEMRRSALRLQQAELALGAAEKKLANVMTSVSSPNSSRRRNIGFRSATDPSTPPNADGVETGRDGLFDANKAPVGPISSSHSPDGQLLHRSWGPEQVLGPPNTDAGGDIPTAWAPSSPQGSGEEWLHLGYQHAVEVAEVRVRETYNPGAVSKIAAVMPDGQEMVVWEGTEPPAQAPVDRSFSVPAGIQANQIKVYLDRQRSPGWNEIDAVELVGRDGTRQWAASATASSSYAER